MPGRYFPIKNDSACASKWNWSTVWLYEGKTGSCCVSAIGPITAGTFDTFHNTDIKIKHRQQMLAGVWPSQDRECNSCRMLEAADGYSERLLHNSIPDQVPIELVNDPSAVVVTPTIMEVFFNNTCNLSCIYCTPGLSSKINQEYKKFGDFVVGDALLTSVQPANDHHQMLEKFWEWFPTGFPKLRRFNILGGEPFYQKEFDNLLDMIEQHPNPDCELGIITNLMVPKAKLENYIAKFRKLLIDRKLKRVDITCSIDCWGPEQEYVRHGLSLQQWEENFKLLMSHKWLRLNIKQTISALTIKTMPELLSRLAVWRQQIKIGHWFAGIVPGPSYMKAEIFGGKEFIADAEKILKLMPRETDEDRSGHQYMKSIFDQIAIAQVNPAELTKMFAYLNENDRRRGANWKTTFPWLTEYTKYVV